MSPDQPTHDPSWNPRKYLSDKDPVRLVRKVTEDPYLSAYRLEELTRLEAEKARREIETLRLYQPMDVQLAFHQSNAPERILIGSNRGGKTTPAMVELAWILTGTHPHLSYPKQNGRAYIVARSQKEIGEVFYRKLFRAGALRIIKDKQTGKWRTFRPWRQDDLSRIKEVKPSQPLIPMRMIQGGLKGGFSWESKKDYVFRKVTFVNGWELTAFTGEGMPPQGADVDAVFFDEEIPHPDWYTEMAARLLDRRGRFVWSATPQVGAEQLYDLSQRADREQVLPREKRSVEKFFIDLAANKYLEQDKKDELAKKYEGNREAYRVRILGQFADLSFKMYPDWNVHTHSYERINLPGGQVPHDWCRYAVIDPGHTVCAVLFAAVPPPSLGDFVYLEGELYIHGCTAAKMAREFRQATLGRWLQAIIIDEHGSVSRSAADGITLKQQYYDALKREGVWRDVNFQEFIMGCDDKQARNEKVREWLRIREDGTTKLRVLADALPNFCWEMDRYKKKRRRTDKGMVVIDEPDDRRDQHLVVDLQYLAAYNPRFVPRPKPKPPISAAAMRLRQKKEKRRQNRENDAYVSLA